MHCIVVLHTLTWKNSFAKCVEPKLKINQSIIIHLLWTHPPNISYVVMEATLVVKLGTTLRTIMAGFARTYIHMQLFL